MQECMELCKEMFVALERGNFIRIKENMDIEYYRCIDRLLSMNIVISYRVMENTHELLQNYYF